MTHPLVKIIKEKVVPYPKPVVYISGGLDSTILLHHLSEGVQEKICTYTYGFPDDNEFDAAREVADLYGTVHKETLIEDFLGRFEEIQRCLSQPRFNIQIFWLAEQAFKDGRKNCYLAEGLDEHFSGYWYKSHLNYVQSWEDHFRWIRPTHLEIHRLFGLNCEIPFTYLGFNQTLPYWDSNREKTFLRKIYRDILPKSVIERRKRSGAPNWQKLWEREICKIFPGVKPTSNEEIRNYLNLYTTWVWNRANGR